MNKSFVAVLFPFIIYAYFIVCWIVNLVQFIQCDFEPSYKDEIIKGIGVLGAPLAGLTVWF